MAQKRMFSLNVVDTDRFLEMPISARLLYYELGMRADDDGFVDSWKKILLFTGLKEDDMKLLIAKSFIIPFESGVIVIKHWRMNNYLQNDRKKSTNYQEELKMLDISSGGEYFLKENLINKGSNEICIQNGSNVYTQYSIDKNSIDKNNIDIYIPAKQDIIPYKEIIDYLNFKTNSNYKYTTQKTKDLIKARLNEKFTLEDFKKVIDNKFNDWNNTDMAKYLRPETLFGNKFEGYLNEKSKNPEWFNKEIKNEEMTEEEKQELDDLLESLQEDIKNIK